MTAPALPTTLAQADAVTLLYAAVTGDRRELGATVRGLLLLHTILPGTGKPVPDCPGCYGTGRAPTLSDIRRHCHCRCDACSCGDALCDGPCETIEVMLEALVLHGTPAAAVDVPRTLDALYLAGVRRVVAHATRRGPAIVDPVDNRPGAAQVTVGDGKPAEMIERALLAEGYECARRYVPGPVSAVRLTATYRH